MNWEKSLEREAVHTRAVNRMKEVPVLRSSVGNISPMMIWKVGVYLDFRVIQNVEHGTFGAKISIIPLLLLTRTHYRTYQGLKQVAQDHTLYTQTLRDSWGCSHFESNIPHSGSHNIACGGSIITLFIKRGLLTIYSFSLLEKKCWKHFQVSGCWGLTSHQVWKSILPWVVAALKLGTTSPSLTAIFWK